MLLRRLTFELQVANFPYATSECARGGLLRLLTSGLLFSRPCMRSVARFPQTKLTNSEITGRSESARTGLACRLALRDLQIIRKDPRLLDVYGYCWLDERSKHRGWSGQCVLESRQGCRWYLPGRPYVQ